MRSIVKALVALVFCLLVALPSFGKLKVLLAIDVEDPSIRQSITSAVSARLNSTDRYTVVESVHGADLLCSVLCVKAKINGRVIGVTCASNVEYYPFESSLGYWLGGAGTMIFDASENLRSMADTLVDEFCQQHDRIQAARVQGRDDGSYPRDLRPEPLNLSEPVSS